MNYGKALAMCGTALVTALALATATSPLHAGSIKPLVVVVHPEDYVSRRVIYADLDLTSIPGERMLKRRVGGAVTEVCTEAVGGLSSSLAYRDCEIGALGGARPQIALAVQRAHELAATGTSLISAAAITIEAGE